MIDTLLGNWNFQLALLGHVAFAGLLGGIVGFERELAERPAGLRTHMLLAAAAALLVGVADLLATRFAGEGYSHLVRVDPVRVVEAVVTAVGFLGAGTIFRHGASVAGLTTAASMLLVATLGIAVGLGQYVLASGATLLALVVLRLLPALERRMPKSASRATPDNMRT
jgi:putative Mg2+ transporter-C (MgtC) family protein